MQTLRINSIVATLRDIAAEYGDLPAALIVNGVSHPLPQIWVEVAWTEGERKLSVCLGDDPR